MIPSSEPTCPHIPCLSLSLKKTQSNPMAIIISIIMRSQLSQVGRESKNSMGHHLLSQCTLSAYCGSAVHTACPLMCRIFVRKSIYALFNYFTMMLFVFQESGGLLSLKEAPLARKARGGGLNHLSQYMLRKQGIQQPQHPCVVFAVWTANTDHKHGQQIVMNFTQFPFSLHCTRYAGTLQNWAKWLL